MANSDKIKLSSKISILKYNELERNQDRRALADFVFHRFSERYIIPIEAGGELKHGFCTMAVTCLMIEALESFWQGLADTNGTSKVVFTAFFKRNPEFKTFIPVAQDFYYNVRCAIFHQAETRNSWKIRRSGPLFDTKSKTINATLFHGKMKIALTDYRRLLETEKWDASIWVNFRMKMRAICDNS